ncbi:ABC transporter permease [Reyranella sp.]|uniref:ABC transporter permease n=1 Tax=Reyranella sp. TaxID=1929291 RepID=UPI004035275E
MPSVKVVNGKQIVVENLGPIERATSFIAKPFIRMVQHRDLIAAILRREVRERFKGSIAGWIWAIIAPLLMIAVYTFAFTTTLSLPATDGTDGTDSKQVSYSLFIFSGLIVFSFFSEMAFRAPMLLHEYTHFIKQTIFPSDMLPVISTLRATAYTLISGAVMLLFQLAMTGSLPWTVLLVPLIFIPFMAFLIGMSWFLAALGAFTRDAGYLMITIVPLFMFATPIFYSHTGLPAPFNFWIYANALTGFVEVMRDVVLFGKLPNMIVYGWTLLISVFSFYFGYWFFDRYRNVIVDVL